jgi:hypothetical protein
MGLCDFGRSFMTWDKTVTPMPPDPRPYSRHMPWGGAARIQLDALLDVQDEATGATTRYVLITPCRSEWMWVDEDLFSFMPDHTPAESWVNSEYRVIYSETEHRFVGRRIVAEQEARRATLIADKFDGFDITIRTFSEAHLLETTAAMIEATRAGLPLVARTEIDDPVRRQRLVLEYPIKTMNFHPPRQLFQVDTGPLLVPDFESEAEHPMERLDVAHVVYNTLDRAEFIARRPTPIIQNGREVCRTLEYSHVRAYPARNQVYAGPL